MTDLLNLIKAKDKESDKNLLKDHLKEVLIRLGQIYEYVDSNKDKLEYKEIKKKELFKLLTKALLLHDIGKINYQFQRKIYRKDKQLDSVGWKELEKLFNKKTKKEIRHEILSVIWSVALFDDGEESKKLRTAVLLHHYNEFWANQEQNLMEIVSNYHDDLKAYLEFIRNNKNEFENFFTSLLDGLIVKAINNRKT